MLRCRNCTATLAFLQCGSHLDQTKNCTATSKKLRCRKVALSCRFPAGFKPPRLGTHVSDLLSGHHSLFSVCMLFLQGFSAFIHGFFPTARTPSSTITLIFIVHYVDSRASGSLITPITFTDSLRSREWWPLRSWLCPRPFWECSWWPDRSFQ